MITLPNLTLERVIGYLPPTVVDNFTTLAPLVGEARARSIIEATGFAQRHILAPEATLFDMLLTASQEAVKGLKSEDFSAIIVVTFSSPQRFPSLAAQVQRALSWGNEIAALDLALACSGFNYGLMVAGQFAASTGRKVLLLDGDAQSKFIAPTDAASLAVMSDAATACVVSATGSSAQFKFLTAGEDPSNAALNCPSAGPIAMDGFKVFSFVATQVRNFLNGMTADWFVPHQANRYMIKELAKSINLEDKLLFAPREAANSGSCSVPLTIAANPTANGHMLLAAFGAGLSASAALLTLDSTCLRRII